MGLKFDKCIVRRNTDAVYIIYNSECRLGLYNIGRFFGNDILSCRVIALLPFILRIRVWQ